MESEISAFLRSEKFIKSVGWFKFVATIVLTTALFVITVGFTSVLATIRKSLDSPSQFNFSVLLFLFILFLVFYAVCTFMLIIGTINHDRVKVSIFLAADIIVTLMIVSGFYVFFFSVLSLVLLTIQPVLLYAEILFWIDLRREHLRRMENQEIRRREQDREQTYREEVERYHARIKTTEDTGLSSSS